MVNGTARCLPTSLINLAGSWSGPVEQSVLMFLITSDTLL